jgi:hypothetical protein
MLKKRSVYWNKLFPFNLHITNQKTTLIRSFFVFVKFLYNRPIFGTLNITLKNDYLSMKDILKKYKKYKKITNIGIVVTSIVLAV